MSAGLRILRDDAFRNLPRFIRRQQLGLHLLSTNVHRELVDLSAFRNRE